jgi:sulfite oxidase
MRRREFLAALARSSAAGVALAAIPPWARQALGAAAAPADLIERNEWPEHWETTLEALGRASITPNDAFFVRSHFPVPELDPQSWRLEVSGLVASPLTLSLAELAAMPQVQAVHTLECAGNGRGLFHLPSTSGTQWEYGAVGNARWGGITLASLLERAQPQPEARHVWFEAADMAPLPAVPKFLRSVPLEKAMKDTLLATTMNDRPLPVRHGAPLRAIVPGWFGMASTKWVTRVRVEATPSDNHFFVRGYRYNYPGEDPAQAAPVEEMRVKSLITRPLSGARVPRGKVPVRGFAWAGPAGVRLVEVSTDSGKSWQPAGFREDSEPMAWRAWATQVDAAPGNLTILARATDGNGVAQPDAARPNAGGYGNNSIHRVTVRVGA